MRNSLRTDRKYGNLPVNLGQVSLPTDEMMFWLYCPVKVPGMWSFTIPDNLRKFKGLLEDAKDDLLDKIVNFEEYAENWYAYITVKTLFVNKENPGNRPGWHSDGFMTNDINYVWSDRNPTVFFCDGFLHDFTADHTASLQEMDDLCENSKMHMTYPDMSLLRLDETVLHKVNTNIEPGMRTFIKISFSKDRYGLKGNSINHLLNFGDGYKDRQMERNDPAGK